MRRTEQFVSREIGVLSLEHFGFSWSLIPVRNFVEYALRAAGSTASRRADECAIPNREAESGTGRYHTGHPARDRASQDASVCPPAAHAVRETKPL
jgi:hypothetical protein